MDVKLLSTLSSGNPPSSPPSLHPTRRSTLASPSFSSSSEGLSTQQSPSSLQEAGCFLPSFTPYSATVPWHTGLRAFFSHFFPKYGHYCGPNWSSGRSSGSLLWDKRPIDSLDHCCFCHDVGYDSHDQAQLYKADLALLECLQKMPPSGGRRLNGNAVMAEFYRSACITGLQTVLLPYRRMLLGDVGARKDKPW